MKKFLLSLVALGITGFVSAQMLPDTKVENQKGEIISTRSLSTGKPMIISFWATTCKPCIQELNAINEQIEDWREEADFDVVAVATDDSRSISRARAMATGFGWEENFICIYDKNKDFSRAMNVMQTPQAFVVDGQGKVVFSHTGYTPGSELELFEKVKELCK